METLAQAHYSVMWMIFIESLFYWLPGLFIIRLVAWLK